MSNSELPILIVDDDLPIRRLMSAFLGRDYSVSTASNVEEAMGLLKTRFFNVVVTDIDMPGASGLELCKLVRETSPDTVVVMMSAMTGIEYAIEAMQQGAFDYITKPFDLARVKSAVGRAVRTQLAGDAKRRYDRSLEQTVRLRTDQLLLASKSIDSMMLSLYSSYRATLGCLAKTLEVRDYETRGHSDRVVAYCLRLGKDLGLSPEELIGLEQGALLHDIGKIAVRDAVLLKPGSLTTEEWVLMREHVGYGLKIIEGVDFLAGARFVIGQHHERYNGGGYPQRLRGDQIHINARIFAVADAYDAITSDRPYRAAQSYSAAREEILKGVAKQFDPKVVEAFLNISEQEYASIQQQAIQADYSSEIIGKPELQKFVFSLNCPPDMKGPLTALCT